MFIYKFFATGCHGGSFLGFPSWDYYLKTQNFQHQCMPILSSIKDVWLIVAAIVELLLRVAGIGAVCMVIYAGVSYTVSMGSVEETTKARQTLIYSMIGLVIAVSAAFIVTFIATRLGA